jgi:hypothetical protein
LARAQDGDAEAMASELDPLLEGRHETPLQRCDRNLVELLQEVRVVQTGVQVLFAFLLIAPLSARFGEVGPTARMEYFASLAAAGGAAVLLMVPTAYHRILFRCGDKEHLVAICNRCTLAGLALVGVAMLGSLLFVSDLLFGGAASIVTAAIAGAVMTSCWCIAPLLRRRHVLARDRDAMLAREFDVRDASGDSASRTAIGM